MTLLGIVWNPEDTLFNLGPLQIKYYNSLWIAAFIVGWQLMKRIFTTEGKPIDKLDSLFVYSVVSIMLGARLGHVFFYDWAYYQHHLIEILLPIREQRNASLFGLINGYTFTGFTGLASHGAAVAAIIGLYLYSRKFKEIDFLWLVDRIAIPSAIGGAFVRLGNFFNSEINGKPVEEGFVFATKFVRDHDDLSAYNALQITGQSSVSNAYNAIVNDPAYSEILASIPYRHPVQLYEAVAYALLFVILFYVIYPKPHLRNKPGFLFGLWLVGIFSARFVLEYFKKSQGGFEESLGLLTTGQWLSIVPIIAGLALMFRKSKVY
jgi:phosphatidylglycerol---prolipoprotein diacylglyceryl transferase